MIASPAPPAPPPSPADHPSLRVRAPNARSRARVDAVMRALLLVTVACALVPLAMILYSVVTRGFGALSWEFFTANPPFAVTAEGGGYAPGIVGTLMMTGIAILLAVPLGVAAAVFLVEFPSRLGPVVRFFTDVMTGVPSIFVGLFVFSAIVIGGGIGWGTLAGGIALAILMLPIVVRSSEEVLTLVPADLRNGAYALGARRWQSVMKVVLPAASPGLITGSMLAVARAAGETAPLLLTALGARQVVTALVGQPQGALPMQILADARSFAPAANARGWAGALTLMAMVLLLTLIARAVGSRSRTAG